MFRIQPQQAVAIVHQLQQGAPWKFDRVVSEQQAGRVIPYLTALGFQIEKVADDSYIRLQPPPIKQNTPTDEIPDDVVEAEEVRLSQQSGALECAFRGDVWDITALYLKLWVFSLLTLGVYSFFGRTHLRRYFLHHTTLGGKPFAYSGSPQELARTGATVAIVLLGLFLLLVGVHQVDPLISPLLESLALGVITLGAVYLRWCSIRYRIGKAAWQGVAFSYQATFRDWLMVHLKGWGLTALTLGLYGPVFWMEAWGFHKTRTHFGGRAFRFSGYWKDIARPYYTAWAVTAVTLGWGCVIWLWAIPQIRVALWSHTHFDRGVFEYTADWKTYARLGIENIFILIFSLGIGYAVVQMRDRQCYARHLALVGLPGWPQLLRQIKAGRV